MKTLRKMSHTPLAWLGLFIVLVALAVVLRLTVKAQDSAGIALWSGVSIGSATGSFQADATGVFTAINTGADLWGRSDSFQYVYQPLNGNGQITARVLGINGTNDWAKAGVMIRETLEAGSRNALMFSSLSHGMFFEWRSVTNGDTYHDLGDTNVVAPGWVRLVRNGDWIGGYSSPDGNNWTLVDWRLISGLASQVYVGLALTSANRSEAGFDQVSVGPADLSEVLNPWVGTGDGLAGSYYNNRHLWGAAVTNQVDAQVNFDLGQLAASGTSQAGITNLCQTLFGKSQKDELGIRWIGEIQAQFTEPYILHVTTDDGMRVWFNEQLVIDDWTTHTAKELESGPLNLVAGQRYLIRIEYFQNHEDTVAKLAWRSPSTPLQLVPQSQLYSQPTMDLDGSGLPVLWEKHYFGQTGVDPNADPDGDGLSNLQEYQQHRDPTNPLNWGVPNEWGHGDIGADMGCSGAGAAVYSNGIFTVTSSGGDIWQGRDSFHYLYQPMGTNGQIVVRIGGQGGNDAWQKGGLMIRETLADTSRNVALLVVGTNGMDFQWRPAAGLESLQRVNATNAWSWLKLVRNEDWVGAYVSADGTNWTLFDWEGISGLAPQVFAGMAVSSHASVSTNSASFDQVSMGPADPAEVMNPQVGTGDGLLGNYRNDSLLYLPGVTNEVDKVIDFDWGHELLLPELNPDSFGVSWSGEIQAQFTEPYTISFHSQPAEWVRVWLNERLIINYWRTWNPGGELSAQPIPLVAGQRYLIRVEMYNDQGRGVAGLDWSSPSTFERPVSQSQMYSQPTMDPDGSGLPVLWEQHYFGRTGVDPNADPDGDALSNLQEYQYHTDPTKADTDGDGIPDPWEIAHGLDPQYPDDAALDYDNSGLSNLQDYQTGLDPLNPDRNGDGLPDWFEEEYLGSGASLSCTNQITVATVVNGSQATNLLGNWQVDGTDIYALNRRGAMDFNLSLSNADIYVFNLIGTQNQPDSFESSFKLLLGIDSQSLGHYTLYGGYGTNGTVELVLPYLTAGAHTVHVFWDGVASDSSLRIRQVRLLAVSGAQTKGIKDWARAMMADQSGLDQTNPVISSYTSPVCLEGRDPYPTLTTMTNNLTNILSATATSDGRWYVNAPLQAGTQTVFQASYQNGGLSESRQLQWVPLNLLTASNGLTIRQGDSLLLNALPAGGANGSLQVVVGTNAYTGETTRGIACPFRTAGVYTVSGTYQSQSRTTQSGSITVAVVRQNLPQVAAGAWTSMQRNLNLSNLAPEAVLQADSRLACSLAGSSASGQTQLTLETAENEQRSILARLGTNGPVLDSTLVSGFDIYSGDQAYTKVVQIYPDGSQLVEMLLICSPVLPQVTFELNIIVSGVVFDDGTTTKTLTASDFDALGQYPVRFIRPASSSTSVCNGIRAYQVPYLVGSRQ